MIIEIDAKLLKAAQQFQAKNDVRYYLNGVCLSKDGRIKATDGHRAMMVEHGAKLEEDIIITINGAVPASATIAKIDTDTNMITFDDRSESVKSFSVIAGEFPEVDRTIPTGDTVPADLIGFNPSYIADAAKALEIASGKATAMTFEFRGKHKALVMRPTMERLSSLIIIVMPCRY